MTEAGGPLPATVDDLDLPARLKSLLKAQGITDLYPPQREALVHALAGENLVLAIPTASGKTLVALLGVIKRVLQGGKALYIVPLKALAAEKFEDFRAFEPLGIKVGMSIGDYDDMGSELAGCDIVVATSEKADSLSRHDLTWIERLSVVVADEVHLMHDPGRGPTLEVLLARIRTLNPRCQVIALSATIQNSEEIAAWLGAAHVTSTFRPVELKEGVFLEGDVTYTDGSHEAFPFLDDPVVSIVAEAAARGEQSLVFVNTRKSTEALAERLAGYVQRTLGDADRAALKVAAQGLKHADAEATDIADNLAACISAGTAFHHAGLSHGQRRAVEGAFKDRRIRCIVATPTLASGINLPAKRVVVRDVRRYDSMYGNLPIPVLEVKQMLGRAGRPRYDTVGQAILVAKDEGQMRDLFERYLLGPPERIFSKLGTDEALRTHVLSSIATGLVAHEEDLERFVASTFYAHQTEAWTIQERLETALDFLQEEELVSKEGKGLWPTKFGRRVSDLYVDPLSAVLLRQAVDRAAEHGKATPLGWLQAICSTPDVPTFFLKRADYGTVPGLAESHRDEFLVEDVESEMDREDFLAEVKTAAMYEDWISELTEQGIAAKYDIGPGDIRSKVDTGRWLIYATSEIARLFDHKDLARELRGLERRVRYGVKGELLPLVELRGVGRRRGRALYSKGFKTPADIKAGSLEDLVKVPMIGPTLAGRLKRMVSGEAGEGEAPNNDDLGLYEPETRVAAAAAAAGAAAAPGAPPQSSLSSFKDEGGDGTDAG
jgi:helicase